MIDTAESKPSTLWHRCSSRARLVITAVALLLLTLCSAQHAHAKRCHKVKSANGKVSYTVYRLPDEDIPFSLYMLAPTSVKRDLEYLVLGVGDASRQEQLQVKLWRDTSDNHLLCVDDVSELSRIFTEKNYEEGVFRCTDLLLNLASGNGNELNVTSLKEAALDNAVRACERRIDQADTYIADKKYSDALNALDMIVRLRDTHSPAAARLDWKKVAAKMTALRPFVKPIQQQLLDYDIWKANYVERVVPLTPEVRALFTQNVTSKDAVQPAQVPQE